MAVIEHFQQYFGSSSLLACRFEALEHDELQSTWPPEWFRTAHVRQINCTHERRDFAHGAAGVLGIARSTAHPWMDAHEEFRDAVSRGQVARAFWLEKDLLETTSGAVVRLRCLALVNAAAEEYGQKRACGDGFARRPLG